MSWFRSDKGPKPPRPELADELLDLNGRLRGWTVAGTSSVDVHGLLRAAANEITRLTAQLAERDDETAYQPRDGEGGFV